MAIPTACLNCWSIIWNAPHYLSIFNGGIIMPSSPPSNSCVRILPNYPAYSGITYSWIMCCCAASTGPMMRHLHPLFWITCSNGSPNLDPNLLSYTFFSQHPLRRMGSLTLSLEISDQVFILTPVYCWKMVWIIVSISLTHFFMSSGLTCWIQ